MKKIKLNLSQLKVDSFETNRPKVKTGTVKANIQDTDFICRTMLTCNFDSCKYCSDLDCSEHNCPSFDC